MEKLSFGEVFAREKTFLMHVLRDDMNEIAKEIWNDYPKQRQVIDTGTQKPDPWILPSIQVLAGVNAVILMSLKEVLTNDLFDIRHAALAIPYYDALFCDNRMAHVLDVKPLAFATTYQTEILSRPANIESYLLQLGAHS